jgi:pyruvate formate lyase activating enzyme
VTGRVLNIQRMSTEDGPGIRTTVFFKGCPLRCTWCHNPESLDPRPQVVFQEARCIGCGTCRTVCPHGCDPLRCTACGRCVADCPAGSREMLGTDWTVDDLVREVVKDRAFFESSGGGVTVSGGEPTMQAPFVRAFLEALAATGVPVAVDTCGACAFDVLERVVEPATLVLFDVKLIDPEAHARHTGQDNARILDNLRRLAGSVRAGDWSGELWVRTPLIPGATADADNIAGIGRFLVGLDGAVARWELCAFNNLCREQYRRLGRKWALADVPLMTRSELDGLAQVARESGVDPAVVVVTGAARVTGPGEVATGGQGETA